MFFVSTTSTVISRKEKFDIVYEKYYKYAYKTAYNILKNAKLMEDIMQDIFLRVWKGLDSIDLDNHESTRAYIGTVARNTAINKYKNEKNITPKMVEVDDDVLYATVSAKNVDPCDIVVNDANVNYIYEKIGDISRCYRDVLYHKYKYERTPEEIAVITGLNIKTVYTKISRGRQILKTMLLDEERRINGDK